MYTPSCEVVLTIPKDMINITFRGEFRLNWDLSVYKRLSGYYDEQIEKIGVYVNAKEKNY